ncbi:hypothetical protein C0J52_01056 [Blattella germanica]|nr:hypothetical protein C0J52_01056 [Blattella germanica]
MKALRESGKEIFYLNETWLDSNFNVKTCWQSDDVFGVPENFSAGNCLILLHGGSKNSFLNVAKLFYKPGSSSDDYHGQMNQQNFGK